MLSGMCLFDLPTFDDAHASATSTTASGARGSLQRSYNCGPKWSGDASGHATCLPVRNLPHWERKVTSTGDPHKGEQTCS
jgi:hypothetical protein